MKVLSLAYDILFFLVIPLLIGLLLGFTHPLSLGYVVAIWTIELYVIKRDARKRGITEIEAFKSAWSYKESK